MNTKISVGGLASLLVAVAACGPGTVAAQAETGPGAVMPVRVVALANGVTQGNPDAPITIAEFADYQCPACGSFASLVKPRVNLAYLQGDDVRFVFYDFPLTSIHPHAFLAARAARCAGDQDMYWEFHDQLFQNQGAWSRSASPPLGLFEDYAAAVGAEASAFRACLRSDRHAVTVSANQQLAQLLGVTGTPTVMVSRGDGQAVRLPDGTFDAISQTVSQLMERGGQASGGDSGGDGS